MSFDHFRQGPFHRYEEFTAQNMSCDCRQTFFMLSLLTLTPFARLLY
jgi:hypothetical protein